MHYNYNNECSLADSTWSSYINFTMQYYYTCTDLDSKGCGAGGGADILGLLNFMCMCLKYKLPSTIIPFSITAVGELEFPTRPHARLLTLNWHITALVDS